MPLNPLKTLTAALLAAPLLASPQLASAAPAAYAIDPTHTSVFFEALHFGVSTNRGRFIKNSGTVSFDKAGQAGQVDLTLDMSGISTGVPPFDKHLMGADFFDVANHPTARFVGQTMVFDGDQVSEVQGALTLRGQTHPVTLKAVRFGCYDNPMLKREVCGGDFETTIKRSLWGVNWGLNFGQADDVKLIIQVEAVKQ
jgi:polyisoprenoid-binding protein YceI